MSLMNPVIAMLRDVNNNRWHPILFYEAPLPGGWGPRRWKSKGHHTDGFDSRERALEECRGTLLSQVEQVACGVVSFCLDDDIPWDGEGVPAMVSFFNIEGEVARLVM